MELRRPFFFWTAVAVREGVDFEDLTDDCVEEEAEGRPVLDELFLGFNEVLLVLALPRTGCRSCVALDVGTVVVICVANILELVRMILVVFLIVNPVFAGGSGWSFLSGVDGGVSAIKWLGFCEKRKRFFFFCCVRIGG